MRSSVQIKFRYGNYEKYKNAKNVYTKIKPYRFPHICFALFCIALLYLALLYVALLCFRCFALLLYFCNDFWTCQGLACFSLHVLNLIFYCVVDNFLSSSPDPSMMILMVIMMMMMMMRMMMVLYFTTSSISYHLVEVCPNYSYSNICTIG